MDTDKKRSFALDWCSSVPNLWPILLLITICSAARAESAWTLTTADFQSRQVNLAGIDDSGAAVTEGPQGAQQRVKWDDLLILARELESKPTTGKFVVTLSAGDRVRGTPVKL